jgi:hypothetical protein
MPMSLGYLFSCGSQRPVVRGNLSLRFITISGIVIGAYPKGIKRKVRTEDLGFFEQKRSDIFVQVDGILCRRLRRWPCRFPNDRRSPKPLVGTFVRIHQMTQLEDHEMLSNPRLKTDVENARLSGSLIQHGLAAWR